MEYNAFRDYCKAENSDDEEINCDLQSRLYAEIYYTSNDAAKQNTKANIKLESFTEDEKIHKDASTNDMSESIDNSLTKSLNNNDKKTCHTNESINDTVFIEKDDKPDIKSLCVGNKVEPVEEDIDNKASSSVSYSKVLKYSDSCASKNNKQSTMHNSLEHVESKTDPQNVPNTEGDVKPELEMKSNEKFASLLDLNSETTTNQCNKSHKATNIRENLKSDGNIFKKYEFSKLFINKLYLEKYESLEKRLHEMEEEKVRKCTNSQHVVTEIISDEEIYQPQKFDNCTKAMNEKNTKYKVLSKPQKVQKTGHYFEEVVLSSETESESEESILEVPIPPKPQPPLINLQDSEESADESSSDNDMEQGNLFIAQQQNHTKLPATKNTAANDHDSDTNTSILDTTSGITVIEDIMLNCTEVQKGASSIKEIMEMSKIANLDECSKPDDNQHEGEKSIIEGEDPSRNRNNSNKPCSSTYCEDVEEHCSPPKTVHKNNVAYERDKNKSVNFAEDVMVSNFLNSPDAQLNRKRHRKDEDEHGTTSNRCTDIGNESKRPKRSSDTWQEYFFRPVSDNIKAFYNESRGQENFDVREMQSKMSKDPRLWAILDEDLMPELLKRHRYWNAKCNNCHQQGHQKHNCPEPYKSVRCYMCGALGHTDTRCPQKMCLTCGKKQGTFRKTCESCRTLYCDMCKAIGHKSTECPDLWRRFHQTTRTTEINIPENLSEVMKPADLLYCCNCTKRGHDSSTCREYRWSQHFPTPAYVSNYTDGPETEVPTCQNTNDDMIPLTKTKKGKNAILIPDVTDLHGCHVVYSYGSFSIKIPTGEEIKSKLIGLQIQDSHLKTLLNGQIYPSFLDLLLKMVKFEIKIYYNPSKELMIRVRSVANTSKPILRIFTYWLKLDDEDKRLKIHISLPRKTDRLLKLLTVKMGELAKNVEDPKHLCNQIDQLKQLMTKTQDGTTLRATSEKILGLRSRLMRVFHTRPKCSSLVTRLKNIIKYLKKFPYPDVILAQYFNAINIYNEIFVPRALTEAELKRFLHKYYSKKNRDAQTKEKENNAKKSQGKEKLTAYHAFIQSLKNFNHCSAMSKAESSNIECGNANASKNIEKQGKHTVTSTTSESSTTSTSASTIPRMLADSTENVSNATTSAENNLNECTNVNPTECIQLCEEDTSSSNGAGITADKTLTSNSVTATSKKTVDTNVLSKPPTNNIVARVPCVKEKSSEQIEKQLKTPENDTDALKAPNEQQDCVIELETNVPKKRKHKKAKKEKLNLESNSQITETAPKDVNTLMHEKAMEIINEALEFKVPYMNKAVEEIRKRINDKNLKQEHIDTLQRLIHLENDHRKYVSSFCNYLQ